MNRFNKGFCLFKFADRGEVKPCGFLQMSGGLKLIYQFRKHTFASPNPFLNLRIAAPSTVKTDKHNGDSEQVIDDLPKHSEP